MRKSTDRILTSHAGSLPRPDDLIDANARREAGTVDEAAFQKKLTQSVADVVRRQVEAGITVPGDGEYGKSMGHKINYRAWWSYSFSRLANLEVKGLGLYDMPAHRSSPGNTVLSSFADRRRSRRLRSSSGSPAMPEPERRIAVALRYLPDSEDAHRLKIGRASCRERV